MGKLDSTPCSLLLAQPDTRLPWDWVVILRISEPSDDGVNLTTILIGWVNIG